MPGLRPGACLEQCVQQHPESVSRSTTSRKRLSSPGRLTSAPQEVGRAGGLPRSSHAAWEPPGDRPDPTALLEQQVAAGVLELVRMPILGGDFGFAVRPSTGVRPERTAEDIDAEGWLQTGDVGAFDPDAYLRIVDRAEQIKRFRIVERDWVAGGDELTPTMKLKRGPIAEKYDEIEELYA